MTKYPRFEAHIPDSGLGVQSAEHAVHVLGMPKFTVSALREAVREFMDNGWHQSVNPKSHLIDLFEQNFIFEQNFNGMTALAGTGFKLKLVFHEYGHTGRHPHYRAALLVIRKHDGKIVQIA